MPAGEMHRYINRLVTGHDGDAVNRLMDLTTQIHPGKRHREDLVHQPITVLALLGDVLDDAALLALVHQGTDEKMTVRQGKIMSGIVGMKYSREEYKRRRRLGLIK